MGLGLSPSGGLSESRVLELIAAAPKTKVGSILLQSTLLVLLDDITPREILSSSVNIQVITGIILKNFNIPVGAGSFNVQDNNGREVTPEVSFNKFPIGDIRQVLNLAIPNVSGNAQGMSSTPFWINNGAFALLTVVDISAAGVTCDVDVFGYYLDPTTKAAIPNLL